MATINTFEFRSPNDVLALLRAERTVKEWTEAARAVDGREFERLAIIAGKNPEDPELWVGYCEEEGAYFVVDLTTFTVVR